MSLNQNGLTFTNQSISENNREREYCLLSLGEREEQREREKQRRDKREIKRVKTKRSNRLLFLKSFIDKHTHTLIHTSRRYRENVGGNARKRLREKGRKSKKNLIVCITDRENIMYNKRVWLKEKNVQEVLKKGKVKGGGGQSGKFDRT